MAWSGQYTADVIPGSDGWTRTASGTPTTENVSDVAGVLHIAQPSSKNLHYLKAEGSPSTYTTHHFLTAVRRVSGGAGRNDVCVQLRAKGKFTTQVSLVSDTQILVESFTGLTWTSDTKTVSSMGSSMHVLEVTYSAGTTTFLLDGTSFHTYSGTQDTAQTANQILFGDNDAGSSSASESYWDNLEWVYGGSKRTATTTSDAALVPASGEKGVTSDALLYVARTTTVTSDTSLEAGAQDLRKILRGETATGNVRIYGATSGQAYRIYNSSGTLIQSAVADGSGVVTFTSTGLPLTAAVIRGFTDNTYATLLSGQWCRTDIQVGNVFDARPSRIGVLPIDTEASYYYPTSQYGGRAQVCESSTNRFILYRKGGMGSSLGGSDGSVVVVRQDKATGLIDQGPVTIRSGIDEGHEVYCIARAPSGKLRFVYGGQNAAVYMRETTSADDITSWGAPVQILGAQFAWAGTFAIDSNGRNHIAAAGYSGGELMYGTSTDAAPTSFTWTSLVSPTGLTSSGWGVLFGDMAVYESGGTVTVGIVWSMYKKDGTFPTNYRYAYYAQTSDNGATWKKAGGSTITVPMSTSGTTGAVSAADEISTAYHYGAWTHLAFLSGAVPHVFVDNGTDVAETYCSVRYWSGSAWTKNSTTVPMWKSGITDYANWGVLLTSDDASRLYLYAANGYPIDPSADTKNGFQLVRYTSTDHFASSSSYVVADGDTYAPLSYAELADTGTDFNTDQTGFCYPKVSTDPRTIVFSGVDKDYSTVFLASLTVQDVTSDALLRLSPTKTITSDAVLLATRTATTTSDANLGSQRTTTVTSDASLTSTTTTQTATITSSALLSARRTATVTSNAAIYTSSSSPAKARIVRDTYVTSDQFGSKTVESDTFGERTTYIHPESTIS